MKQKDIELIASVLGQQRFAIKAYHDNEEAWSVWHNTVNLFVSVLATRNPRFDKTKFWNMVTDDNINR